LESVKWSATCYQNIFLKETKSIRWMDPIDVIKLYTENILPLPKYMNISIHILHLFPPTCA